MRTRSSKLLDSDSSRYSLNLSGTALSCQPAVLRSGCKTSLQSSLLPLTASILPYHALSCSIYQTVGSMSEGMRGRWQKFRGWGVSPASPGPFWRQKNWKVELWCQCHRGRLQQHLPCSTKGFALTPYFKHHPMTIISFSPFIEQISEFKQSRYGTLISNVINMAAN